MKNKLLKILALAVSLVLLVSTFVACDNNQSGGAHEHVYDQKVADETTLKEDATCTHAPIYYYTCSCGEKGTKTFEEGRALDHIYDQMKEENKYLENEGDCQNPATYYYSCKCGLMGTEMFESDEVIDHNFEDGICTICGEPEFEE